VGDAPCYAHGMDDDEGVSQVATHYWRLLRERMPSPRGASPEQVVKAIRDVIGERPRRAGRTRFAIRWRTPWGLAESSLERRLGEAMHVHPGLRGRFQSQAWIGDGRYRVDFLFPLALVVVEADGTDYHSGLWRRVYDWRRDRYLHRLGLTVLHFTQAEVEGRPHDCAERVWIAVKAALPPPPGPDSR